MISAHRLTKKFGKTTAVDSIDLNIPKGQVVGFLGPNGAGKTTTIRMICGFLRPTAGRVEVDGLDVVRESIKVRSRIGYLPESAASYPEMRVCEYLKFRAGLYGLKRAKSRDAIAHALKRCWIDDVKRKTIGQLSKGYRQRVGLASAILHSPEVLILDEPTSGLDPSQIREVRGLIRELAGQHTILLSSHILPEVELTCDRIIMIAAGKIQAEGTIEELRTKAAGKSQYVVETDSSQAQQYLNAINGIAEISVRLTDDGWHRLTIIARDGAGDLREAISSKLSEEGCLVREIHREAPSLEHLFLRMISEPQATAADGNKKRIHS